MASDRRRRCEQVGSGAKKIYFTVDSAVSCSHLDTQLQTLVCLELRAQAEIKKTIRTVTKIINEYTKFNMIFLDTIHNAFKHEIKKFKFDY